MNHAGVFQRLHLGGRAAQTVHAAFHQDRGSLRVLPEDFSNKHLSCDSWLSFFLSKEQPHVVLYCSDSGNSKAFNQHLSHIRAEESRKRRTQMDIFHT